MKLSVDLMNQLDKEIAENQKKRIEQEIERRSNDSFYRFGTRALSGTLKMFNLPGDIYSAVTGKKVENVVPQYYYPEAKDGWQKAADIAGILAGEVGESALLGAMLAPLGIGSKVASGTAKLLKGGKTAQVVGKIAGSAVENIAEDLISDTARGIADKKSAGEIAKDFGTSVLLDTAAAGVLEGLPAVVRGVKNSRAASKAASAAKEAAEDVGRTIDDSRRMWSEIGGTADDAADIAADAARAQHRALSAASAAAESAPRSTDDNIDALIRDVFGYGDAQTKGITEELAEDLPNAGARGRMELEGGADYGRQIQAQAEELRRGDGVVYGDPAGGNRKQYTANDGRGTESLLRKYAETQESFERRVSEVAGSSGGTYEGKRYVLDQHGSGRIAYRLPDAVDPASPAGKAAQAFEENGIRVVVTDGPFESNLNGLTTRHTDAVTAPDGTIYLASNASIDPEHIVPHESVHVLKRTGNSAYDDFYDAMYSHMRYNTPEYNAVADKINQAHYNGRYDINDPDSFDSLFTELSAYIHEFLETDPAYARQLFSGMFDDWDAIVAADRALTDALAGLSRRGQAAARSADDNIDALVRDVFGYGDVQTKGFAEELTERLPNVDAGDGIKEKGSRIEIIHPLDDPDVAKDVIVDPNAVYGYKPKPGSSLDQFDIDWSNADEVGKARAVRLEYLKDMEAKKAKLAVEIKEYLDDGKNMKEIAEIKVKQRNMDRIRSYTERGDYENLQKLYRRNLKEYGRKEGPTAEQLLEKYGSYEEIIYSSVKVNKGMNVILNIEN